jgi:RNA polymerase sigma factor (sigma-70 family)
MSALFRPAVTVDFDRLYRRHAASVYRYAFAVLGNHADAEDVAQQTFMNAYRAIAQGTKPRKAENWLLRIAHNEVRRHFRDTQGKPREVELDDRLAHPALERSEPSLADVIRGLQHLPPTQRSALVMREFEGRSYAEIAELLDVSQSALEGLIFRARRGLAEHLQDALTCAEAEEALCRRIDSRLPRREGRRLRAHLRECPPCVRFAELQKRQRSLLKGLSIMPVPASLFLFRGEQAAAGGLGLSTVAAGGSTAVAGGGAATAAAGATGFVATFAMKAAAVTAAVGVVGGVGYGVTTSTDTVPRADRVAQAAAVSPKHPAPGTAEVPQTRAGRVEPGPLRAVDVRAQPKAATTKEPPAPARASRAKTFVNPKKPAEAKKPKPAEGRSRAHESARPVVVKTRPAPGAARNPKPVRKSHPQPEVGNKVGRVRPVRTTPSPPPRAEEKPKPPRDPVPTPPANPAPTPPANPAGRGPKT